MEIKFGKDGSAAPADKLTKADENGNTVTEVETTADADAVEAEVMPDERPRKVGWSPVAKPEPKPAKPEDTACRALVQAAVAGAMVPANRDARTTVLTSDDSISLGDIIIPTINIVQGVGELCSRFDPGALVYDKKVQIANPPPKQSKGTLEPESSPSIEMIVIGFRPTRWTEKIAGGEQGRICNTEQRVYEIGGTTNYNEAFQDGSQVMPFFQPLATALVLIRLPDGVEDPDELFPYAIEVDGKVAKYGLAAWHFRGTAFTNGARPLKTARKLGFLKGGYPSKPILVTTVLKTFGSNRAYVPKIRPAAKPSTPEQVELAREVLESLTQS